jgi:TolB-like protein
MKYILLMLFFFNLIFTGCGSSNLTFFASKESEIKKFSFIDGKVIEKFGNKVIIKIYDKDIITGDSLEDKLTNKIMKSSLFVMGMKTLIGDVPAKIIDIRGDKITFEVTEHILEKDSDIKIYIPKKIIAVMDFDLKGIKNDKINKIIENKIVTKLVQSGQYIVVERNKLNTILKEHKLIGSGLVDEKSISKIGKLLSADIILTGSFIKNNNKWNVILKILDVKTGVILAAINDKMEIREFRTTQVKDSGNITENFEDENLNIGWLRNLINKQGSQSYGTIDNTMGANGTHGSYRIDYLLTKWNSVATIINKRLRDISQYKGIRFYAKSLHPTTLSVVLIDKNFNNSATNKWVSLTNVRENWKEYKIPFNRFILIQNGQDGDGVLDLDNIVRINFGIIGKLNRLNRPNSLWLDEITFY